MRKLVLLVGLFLLAFWALRCTPATPPKTADSSHQEDDWGDEGGDDWGDNDNNDNWEDNDDGDDDDDTDNDKKKKPKGETPPAGPPQSKLPDLEELKKKLPDLEELKKKLPPWALKKAAEALQKKSLEPLIKAYCHDKFPKKGMGYRVCVAGGKAVAKEQCAKARGKVEEVCKLLGKTCDDPKVKDTIEKLLTLCDQATD